LSGFTPIPLKLSGNHKLIPAIPWKDFQISSGLEELGKIRELFSSKEVVGIAIKAGAASGLVVLDIDNPEKFEAFYPLKNLIEEAPYVVQTKDPGHYHIGFAYEPEFIESKNFLNDFGFEFKTNGALVNFFTVLPEAQYKPLKLEPLRPMPRELKEKLLSLLRKGLSQEKGLENQPSKNLDLREIIEVASEAYREGCRQFWTIYMAGYLRKLGFSFEETKEALESFLREREDEEIDMRLAGIKHTYMEPLENVKGLSGLLELGLSEKVYSKLHALRVKEGKGSSLKVWTAEELLKTEFPKPTWLIPGVLPEGLTLLSGKPKVGKSWLALLLCIELARTTGKPIVYFALEDKPARLKARLQVLGIEDPANLHFVFSCPRLDRGGREEIQKISELYNPLLIVIDPWVAIKPKSKATKTGTDVYLTDYENLAYFKRLTEQGTNILIVHHKRKVESEDPLDEILGTTGMSGAVDNVLSLKRKRGDKIGALEVIARDYEEQSWGLIFENGKWLILGEAREVMMADQERRIIEAIGELGGTATPKAVAEYLNKNYHTIKNQMQRMLHKGILRRGIKGTYLLNQDTKETFLLDLNDKRSSLSSLSSLCSLCSLCSPTHPETTGTTTDDFRYSLSEPLKNLGSEAKDYKDYKDYTNNIEPPLGTPTPTQR
jgi:DNA-binding CsgD family transcriptional regulator